MIVDYFAIRHGNLTVFDLYNSQSDGTYFYYHGFNLRAFTAFVIGFLMPLPGFIGSFGSSFSVVADRLYWLGWVLSLSMGSLSYYLACRAWPVPGDDQQFPFEAKAAQILTYNISGGEELSYEAERSKDQISKKATTSMNQA
jgi:NCS1 family nucleobase:cation symporter-1